MNDDPSEGDRPEDHAAGQEPEKVTMQVALADGLCWNAFMRVYQYGRWYIDVTATTHEEDFADGVPDLVNRLRYAASRGIMAFS